MQNRYEGKCEQWEVDEIKKVVAKKQRTWPILQREGAEDLLQECILYWFEARKKYDPCKRKSLKNYIWMVVEGHLGRIAESFNANKRSFYYKAASLDEVFDDGHKKYDPPDKEVSFVFHDFDVVLNKLSPEQQKICALIREENMSPHQVSKRLCKHHSYIYRELRRIMEVFENEQLREYLK